MILFGASGHGKVILSALESMNITVGAIFDDDLSKTNLDEYPVIGRYTPSQFAGEEIIITVGDNHVRKKISLAIKHRFGIAIHSSAVMDRLASINEGTVVLHNSVIQRGTKIGRHCIINTCASIDHDCTIDDFVHISPNATLCGNVTIGEGTHIGAGAVILPNITIGSWCRIGAGSVVVNDIPDACTAIGIPARIKNRS